MPRRQERPKLGQNFLVSPAAQSAIVDALGDLTHRTVVEIGPGRGAITRLLDARAHRLIAIELDRNLAPQLREQFASLPSVQILQQDILSTDFAALRRNPIDANAVDPHQQPPADKLLVVGNLPYYITTDILLHLFHFSAEIERAIVMIQREVADRLAAQPGTHDYGILSVTTQMYARVEKLMTLPPEAFSPPPQVHSTVLRLTMAPRFEELHVPADAFIAFIRSCFAQKRKMLAKNLRNAGHDPATIAAALESCSVSPQARAEEVPLDTMSQLFRRLSAED